MRSVAGPVIYFPFFEASFGSVSGSLVLQGAQKVLSPIFTFFSGFGSSALLVASFGSAQIAAIEAGFPESMEVKFSRLICSQNSQILKLKLI